ncbi:tryptophan--tRNA ligase [Cryomyces antarcticus]|uniref:Tryptophanyl-tRNA synthetase n=1 Tax=Cryomyces antarcticus TaxID=329879 RepID=A0ABR0M9F8_9PEZI|nr:tryptophan--tRNA ligase [Cryomyces antarcticus]
MASVEHLSTSSGAPPAVEQTTKAATAAREQHVDPLNVSGAIDEQGNVLAFDYEALRQKFDTALIDEPLRQRFERVTGKKLHRLIRRGHFFSHRDLDKILDCYERGDTFFIYTGRGPSSDSMHLGHAIPFLFTKELQDIFDVPVVIMLTDDEKFQFRGAKEGRDLGEFLDYAYSNAKDIIAMGFDVKKTFIYSDVEFFGGHYMQNVTEFETLLTNNQVRGAMGFDGSAWLPSRHPIPSYSVLPTSADPGLEAKAALRSGRVEKLLRYLVSFHAPSIKTLTLDSSATTATA